MNAPTPPKAKRRNAVATKAKILAAAQKAFAEIGYARAGIRDIAAIADVSSTLLIRYFGSKAALFEAALIDAIEFRDLLSHGREGFGERLAQLFTDMDLEITPPAIIALSTGDPESRDIAARVAREHTIAPMAEWLGPPHGEVRALEIFMLSTSFVLYSRQLPLAPSGGESREELKQWLAQSVQAIVNRR